MAQIKGIKLKDLIQDSRNANKGNAKGDELLNKSIKKNKLGRGIAMSNDGVIIAGNHAVQSAISQGYTNAVVVETDGSTLVITKRTDIESDTAEFHNLAIADNQTAKVGIEFDFEVLDMLNEEFDLDTDFMPVLNFEMPEDLEEYGKEGDNTKYFPNGGEFDDSGIAQKNQFGVIVMCEDDKAQQSVFERLISEGFKCKIVVV